MPNDIDIHVGARLRLRRRLLDMSQAGLGHAVGLSLQQIQKYERGQNRIGAGRLYQFSQVLNVPISYFFDDMPDVTSSQPAERPIAVSDEGAEVDQLLKGETLALVDAYYQIPERRLRNQLRTVAQRLAELSL